MIEKRFAPTPPRPPLPSEFQSTNHRILNPRTTRTQKSIRDKLVSSYPKHAWFPIPPGIPARAGLLARMPRPNSLSRRPSLLPSSDTQKTFGKPPSVREDPLRGVSCVNHSRGAWSTSRAVVRGRGYLFCGQPFPLLQFAQGKTLRFPHEPNVTQGLPFKTQTTPFRKSCLHTTD